MSVQNPDNFSHLAEVCVAVWTISRSRIYFASRQFLFGLTHTSEGVFGGPRNASLVPVCLWCHSLGPLKTNQYVLPPVRGNF